MPEILHFAQSASPLGIIALLGIIIFYLISSKGMLQKFRFNQISDTESVAKQSIKDVVDLALLNKKLDGLVNNHLHELPEMKKTLDRIEIKQNDFGERLAVVETTVTFLREK